MPLKHIQIVLVRPRGSGNVGAVARAIANHGLGGLCLVDPPAFDPDHARWMAPGAHDIVNGARIVETVAEAVGAAERVVATTARQRRMDWPVWSPQKMTTELCGQPRPTAILFGPEDMGLSNEDMVTAEAILELPTEALASLNLAQAVIVTAAHLRAHAHEVTPQRDRISASIELRAEAVDQVMGMLTRAGHLKGRTPTTVASRLHRWLARADLDTVEFGGLRGMINRVEWLSFPETGPSDQG